MLFIKYLHWKHLGKYLPTDAAVKVMNFKVLDAYKLFNKEMSS